MGGRAPLSSSLPTLLLSFFVCMHICMYVMARFNVFLDHGHPPLAGFAANNDK